MNAVEPRLTVRSNGDIFIDGGWVANNHLVWTRMVEFVVANGGHRPGTFISFGDSPAQAVAFATGDHEWLRFSDGEFIVEGKSTTNPFHAYLALLGWLDACRTGTVKLSGPFLHHSHESAS